MSSPTVAKTPSIVEAVKPTGGVFVDPVLGSAGAAGAGALLEAAAAVGAGVTAGLGLASPAGGAAADVFCAVGVGFS
jgi:hypothetical protein